MISEDQRKKYEEQYGEFTHKLEEKKTEFQKEHPEKQVQEEKVLIHFHFSNYQGPPFLFAIEISETKDREKLRKAECFW